MFVKLSDVKVGTRVIIAVGSKFKRGRVLKHVLSPGWSICDGEFCQPDKFYTSIMLEPFNMVQPFYNPDNREVLVDEAPTAQGG